MYMCFVLKIFCAHKFYVFSLLPRNIFATFYVYSTVYTKIAQIFILVFLYSIL
jgi:hypothetical protein